MRKEMQTIKTLGLIFILMNSLQFCVLKNKNDAKTETNKDLKIETKNTSEKFIFIDYDKVIIELKTNKNFETIKYKYDFTFILLLDSAEINLIKGLKPEIIEEFRKYAPELQFNKMTVGFVTEKKGIKEILLEKSDQKRIFECLYTENSPDIKYLNFDPIIYIKRNIAIFKISGPTWSNTYFARLENNVIQINFIEGIIE
jgi:hypothetical protein